jgi:hypothetical protein
LPLGFCPKCQEEVFLKRNELDICLLIILTLFTAGIGTIIYLIIYYSDEPKRCVKCNSICLPLSPQNRPKKIMVNNNNDGTKNLHHKTINYCPECGVKLGNSSNQANFCPFCGSNLKVRERVLSKNIDCSVCHKKVFSSQNSIKCSFCGATFHNNCVSSWLLQHNACPLCQNRFIIPKRA